MVIAFVLIKAQHDAYLVGVFYIISEPTYITIKSLQKETTFMQELKYEEPNSKIGISNGWSGSGGYAQGGGRRFKSHRPRSTRFYVEKYATCDFDGNGRAAFLRFKSFFLFL